MCKIKFLIYNGAVVFQLFSPIFLSPLSILSYCNAQETVNFLYWF